MTDDAPLETPSTCRSCGRPADDPTAVLTWSLEVRGGGAVWFCPECSRHHLDEVEARVGLGDLDLLV